jgi:hypothetical protein
VQAQRPTLRPQQIVSWISFDSPYVARNLML